MCLFKFLEAVQILDIDKHLKNHKDLLLLFMFIWMT